jgi:hypothetical protein
VLQGMLRGAGPVGYYRKVLRAFCLQGVLLVVSGSPFLDPRFGCFMAGRFVLGFSFLEQSVVSQPIPACTGLRVTGYGLRV